MLETESFKTSRKWELYTDLLSELEEDFGILPSHQVIIPGGVIVKGTAEEEEAQCKEIEARIMREHGRKPKGTVIIIQLWEQIEIIGQGLKDVVP